MKKEQYVLILAQTQRFSLWEFWHDEHLYLKLSKATDIIQIIVFYINNVQAKIPIFCLSQHSPFNTCTQVKQICNPSFLGSTFFWMFSCLSVFVTMLLMLPSWLCTSNFWLVKKKYIMEIKCWLKFPEHCWVSLSLSNFRECYFIHSTQKLIKSASTLFEIDIFCTCCIDKWIQYMT